MMTEQGRQADHGRVADAMDVVDWRGERAAETIDVLSRAFAENPIHVAAFGADSVVERNGCSSPSACPCFAAAG